MAGDGCPFHSWIFAFYLFDISLFDRKANLVVASFEEGNSLVKPLT